MALQNNAIVFTKEGDESDVNRIRFRDRETQKALKILLEKKTYTIKAAYKNIIFAVKERNSMKKWALAATADVTTP